MRVDEFVQKIATEDRDAVLSADYARRVVAERHSNSAFPEYVDVVGVELRYTSNGEMVLVIITGEEI